jgi:hypothetical protein
VPACPLHLPAAALSFIAAAARCCCLLLLPPSASASAAYIYFYFFDGLDHFFYFPFACDWFDREGTLALFGFLSFTLLSTPAMALLSSSMAFTFAHSGTPVLSI